VFFGFFYEKNQKTSNLSPLKIFFEKKIKFMNSKPWLASYPADVPAQIDPTKYTSLLEMVGESMAKFADLPAYVMMGKSLTFGEVDVLADQFGAYLQSRGLKPGDRIVLMMPNLLQYPIALFGALRAGLIVVNTNPLYTPREMKHQFTDSGARAIVICENFAANLETILGETQIDTIITTSIGEMLGFKGILVNFAVRYIKKLVPKFSINNTVCFADALAQGKKFTLNRPPAALDDTIILQYTGGTTGVSKGAMLTHRNLLANMMQIRAVMKPQLREGKEIALCALPLYHIFAFTVNCLAVMSLGGQNVLITNARDIPGLVKELKNTRFTLITGINTLFNALLNNQKFGEIDFKELRITCGGGMAVQRVVAEKWQAATGCVLAEGYGMTESSPLISVNPFTLAQNRIGTIGLPAPSTDVRLMKENGEIVPIGSDEIGEIQARGPQIMKGYWNRPDETVKTITADGWLATGDLGTMSADGFLKIVDRKKDMILVSGFNVYPNEIEDVVAMHPKVLEVCAVGIPDEKSGEVVKIFVVKKDSSLTEEEIIAHCRENLTSYKLPKKVEFRKDLPKTNVGKILRRELRDSAK
jgi:long-chain acyl-CoA synthetase